MSYTALYRKWRPKTLDEVKGQDAICRTLKNQESGTCLFVLWHKGNGKNECGKDYGEGRKLRTSSKWKPLQ